MPHSPTPATERRFQGAMSEDYLVVMQGIPHLADMDRQVRKLIEDHPSPEGRRLNVLEIGCGPGRATANILSARTDLDVVAIDNEPTLVLQAKTHLAEAIGRGTLSVVETDALAYLQSLPDGHWDIVVAVLCLHNLESHYRNRVLREIHRTLTGSGLFINADKYPPDDAAEFSRILQDHIRLFFDGIVPSGRLDLLKDVVLHELADFSPQRIMKETESVESMIALGFHDCRFHFRKNFDCVLTARKKREA